MRPSHPPSPPFASPNKSPLPRSLPAVSKAFQCLSDPDLRSNYDQFGHEDPQAMARQRQRNAHAQRRFEDDFDPNDIFNAFFGGHGMMNDHLNGIILPPPPPPPPPPPHLPCQLSACSLVSSVRADVPRPVWRAAAPQPEWRRCPGRRWQ